MLVDETARNDDVIDAQQWLVDRVERLIRDRDFTTAIRYLRRMVQKFCDESRQREFATYLGYLYLLIDDPEASETWLDRARDFAPEDPHLRYGLGHVAAARGKHARATLRFLEAFVEADETHDEAEFLRSAALTSLQATGTAPAVAEILLGALDRDLGNPWILDALARVYQADERWMETLETLSVLEDVVDNATDSVVVHRAPTARQLLRNQLMGRRVRPDELRRRARAINEVVRDQFEVVLDERHRRGPTELRPLRFPPALNRLLRMLEHRERAGDLVEDAQHLWARARGAEFDEMLGVERLAGAIHVLVERLHWRVPTPRTEIARIHGASLDAIGPSARLIAGRLQLEPFDRAAIKRGLDFREGQALDEVTRAMLFGEGLDDIRSGETRLGG